ncbi:hypothetical protein [Mycolicibacterium nivoides]|uniref:hypothetical protein n=1 Tax=Mycolicibacterium nivoides TaxID=2487344 RepID=UPI000F5BD2FE|nr:hypothetical protein [Mycolicibacterium nivoides]
MGVGGGGVAAVARPSTFSKARALAGGIDQAFSSLSNGLIIYAIAVVTTVADFGRVGLVMTLLAAAIGVLRGALGTPLLLSSAKSVTDVRREGGYAITTAFVIAPVVGIAMVAVAGPAVRTQAVLLLLATPVVLVQDVLRYIAIAEGCSYIAAIWDGVWFVGSALLLVGTWLRLPYITATSLVCAWGLLALVALLGMLVTVRVRPRLAGCGDWLADGWRHRLRYGTEAGLEQVTVFAVLLFVMLVLSPAVTAAIRGAMAVLAPLAILASAVPLIVISEGARLTMRPTQVWRILVRVTAALSLAAVTLGMVLYFLPLKWGEFLLGETFAATQQIVPIIACEYALGGWAIAVAIYLRTFNRSRDALGLKVGYVAVMLVTSFGAAVAFRTASGVALGMVAATAFVATMAVLWFRPWAGDDVLPRMPHLRILADPKRKVRPLTADSVARPELGNTMAARLASRVPASNGLLTLWVGAILVIFGPVAIIRYTGVPDNGLWLWSLPVIVLAGMRFAWLIGTGERRLFEMMYWAFAYAFLGLAPLAQLRMDAFPTTIARIDQSLIGVGSLIAVVGCCAFLLGAVTDNAMMLRGKAGLARQARHLSRVFTIDHTRLLLLVAFAVILNVYYLSKVGWIQFLKSRDAAFAVYDAIWQPGTPGAMVRGCSYMALLMAFVALVRFRRELKRATGWGFPASAGSLRLNLVLILLIGALLANSVNPISNARYLSGTAILGAATALGLAATRTRFRIMAASFLLGLLVVFPLADAFRYGSQADFKAANPIEALLSPDYDSFGQLVNGFLVAERNGIVPGRQLLGMLLFAVPRKFWEDKPVDSGILIANVRGYSFTNLSAPLWVEFYLNGGWILLVLGMFGLGWWLHRIDTGIERQFNAVGMPALLSCVLPFYMMILLRGSLLQAASYLFFILLFAAFLRRSSAGPQPAHGLARAPDDPLVFELPDRPRENHVRV